MNITINTQHLASELRLISKVIPSKPAIQILGHVLLRASDDILTLYGTDLEIGLVSTCHAQVHAPGVVALPALHFLALVEQFADGEASISLEKHQVLVTCGAFKSRLQAFSADDFPSIPESEGDSSTFNMDAFQQLIGRTRYAINAASAKSVLQGAQLTLTQSVAALAATDGKRLALATIGYEGADAVVIVPAKTLDMLSAQPDAGEVELTLGRRHLFFKVGERLLISRAFEGKFPKYEKIIPRDNDKVVSVGRHALSAALKRVRLVSAESRAVFFSISPGAITLSSSSAEIGAADETVAATYEGPALKVCVNGDYVLDFLDAARGQSVQLTFKDAASPLLLMDGNDHISVIMLMR